MLPVDPLAESVGSGDQVDNFNGQLGLREGAGEGVPHLVAFVQVVDFPDIFEIEWGVGLVDAMGDGVDFVFERGLVNTHDDVEVRVRILGREVVHGDHATGAFQGVIDVLAGDSVPGTDALELLVERGEHGSR